MYTAPENVLDILHERRKNLELIQKIEKYLGTIPETLQHDPKAILARAVATPNLESERFIETAERMRLKPAWMEFSADKFTSANPDKKALGKLTFDLGRGRNGGKIIRSEKVVNFNAWDGKPFRDIKTLSGEGLVDFHHRLLSVSALNERATRSDVSSWLADHGGSALKYYVPYLTLFVAHGALCEVFSREGKEADFTQIIILPALEQIKDMFGFKPIIVAHLSPEAAHDPSWTHYSGALLPALQNNENRKSVSA